MSKKKATKLFLTGKMGSGKDAATDWFEDNYDVKRWTRTDLMKRLAHSLTDHIDSPDKFLIRLFSDEEERDSLREELIAYSLHYIPEEGKQRRLYQDITEICQKYDPYCFERELDARINLVDSNFSLIDDVRKLSAFEYFTDRGYKSLCVEATEEVRRARMLKRDGLLPSEETFQHSSETELDNVKHDFVVENNTDNPEDLYEKILVVANTLDLPPKVELDTVN